MTDLDTLAIRFADGDAVLFVDGGDGHSGWVEVFRAGNYPQGDVAEAAVAEIVQGYDEAKLAAPISIDHQDKGPAYGWVSKLRAVGGRLFARFRDIVPEFRELVATAYPRRSVELYPPAHKANPTPGKWYLRAVSFLGVKAPAVKGMDALPAAFADDRQALALNYEEWTEMAKPDDKPQPTIDAAKLAEIETKLAKFDELATGVEALKAENEKLKTANATLATRVASAQSDAALREEQAFCEALSREGKLVPSLSRGLPEALVALRELPKDGAGAAVVVFTEGEGEKATELKQSPYEFLRAFVAQLGKLVTFGETAADPGSAASTRPAWAGKGAVDVDLDAKAKAFIDDQAKAGKTVDYADALVAVAT